MTLFQLDITYNAANKMIRDIYMSNNGNGLENDSKDTFGYTGTMRTFQNSYQWDTAAKAWNLYYEERRHLNASSLPDSVRGLGTSSAGTSDTVIYKLAYNGQGNPVYKRTFAGNNATAVFEDRWYYEPLSTGGVGVAGVPVKNDLTVFPNPATGRLYIKGGFNGRYIILNAAGQIVQSGSVESAGNAVPVSGLPAGIYTLSLQDKADGVHVAQFVRQ